MDRKKLSIRLVSLIFFIFAINFLAMKFYWYSLIWYFDMPMHFLGGLWLGLILFWIFSLEKVSFRLFLKVILCVLIIGLFWEIFEIILNNYTNQFPFNTLDTLSDICLDLSGGIFSILYFLKRIMLFEEKKRYN